MLLNPNLNTWLIKIFYGLILLLTTTLTGYRLKIWMKDYGSLSSKYYISSVLTGSDSSVERLQPTLSICNINPARGSHLLSREFNIGTPQDYELFVDTVNGRVNRDVSASRLLRPYFEILDRTSHSLVNMLKYCSVGKRKCSHLNFTKSLLPTGACYTFSAPLSVNDDITLELDPEIHEYLVPNSGLAGFRVLIHSHHDPLWVALSNSMFVGPSFHTYIRVNEIEKRFEHQCSSQDYWILCMHQCLEKSVFQHCKCYLMGTNACTLSSLMNCHLNLDKLIDTLKPDSCGCARRCRQVSYRLESITQSVRSSLFSALMTSWRSQETAVTGIMVSTTTRDSSRLKIRHGRAIQLWAYLREANLTAFEDLRNLTVFLNELLESVKQLDNDCETVRTQLDRSCLQDEAHRAGTVVGSGQKFVSFMRQTELLLLADSPHRIAHVHLAGLLFRAGVQRLLRVVQKFIDMSSFISDLNGLDSSFSNHNCLRSRASGSSNNIIVELNKNNFNWKETYHSMESVYFKFITTFSRFKQKFLSNVHYNKEIIDRISNLTVDYSPKRATLTVQIIKSENIGYQLESAQNIYDPHLAIIDIIISGLVITFVFITLANKCLRIKQYNCVKKKNGIENHREVTIQNNLSTQNINNKQQQLQQQQMQQQHSSTSWSQHRDSVMSRDDQDSPVTTFHLI